MHPSISLITSENSSWHDCVFISDVGLCQPVACGETSHTRTHTHIIKACVYIPVLVDPNIMYTVVLSSSKDRQEFSAQERELVCMFQSMFSMVTYTYTPSTQAIHTYIDIHTLVCSLLTPLKPALDKVNEVCTSTGMSTSMSLDVNELESCVHHLTDVCRQVVNHTHTYTLPAYTSLACPYPFTAPYLPSVKKNRYGAVYTSIKRMMDSCMDDHTQPQTPIHTSSYPYSYPYPSSSKGTIRDSCYQSDDGYGYGLDSLQSQCTPPITRKGRLWWGWRWVGRMCALFRSNPGNQTSQKNTKNKRGMSMGMSMGMGIGVKGLGRVAVESKT
ncbi:hypothetical protein EON63_01870 [archaeon]|nr:MAG: hypothetical protein EON63_01870 [archaeon]